VEFHGRGDLETEKNRSAQGEGQVKNRQDGESRSERSVGVQAVTIEDNSSRRPTRSCASELQPLADVEEFCGKIKAGKDSQPAPTSCWSRASRRLIAKAGVSRKPSSARRPYHSAGADRDLITAASEPAEIFACLGQWSDARPWCWCRRSTGAHPRGVPAREEGGSRNDGEKNGGTRATRQCSDRGGNSRAESLRDVEPTRCRRLHDGLRLQGDEE